jgi:hypothetical protein
MKTMGHPVEHLNVPHPGPAEVEKASAKFEEISAAFQAARAKFYALKTSHRDDRAAANLAHATARVEGKPAPSLTPAKIDANLAKAETDMNVLSEATDVAGTALWKAVRAARDEWVKVYEAAEVEAEQRVADLIALQRQATDDLGTARVSSRWLREFTGSSSQTQFPGVGHSVADFSELEKLVHGEARLVGYAEGKPIWKTVKS